MGSCTYRVVILSCKFIVSFMTMYLLVVTVGYAQPDSTRKVLILNSYHKEFKWTDAQISAAKEVLSEGFKDLELFVEYMDTKRIYNKEYLEYLYHIYRLKYKKVKLDAIITTDDNALWFVVKYHKEVFGEAPVSFCGINDYKKSLLEGKQQFTGLVEVLDIKPTIDLALKLHPKTRKIVVIVDSTPTGLGQIRDVAAVAREYNNLKFEYLEGKDISHAELFEKLRSLSRDSIVLLAVWLRDKNNVYLSSDEGGRLISSNSTVPVYGIIDMYHGYGIVGGKLLNSRTHGRIAAEKALRVINGEKPVNIPVISTSINPYMFDYKQLERWKISVSDLPKGSIIINKPFSSYEKYKRLIWIVIGVFAFLISIVAILTMNIFHRKRVEEALRESEERYRNLYEEAPAGYMEFDTEGRIINVNKKELEMFGYTYEEMVGQFLWNFIIEKEEARKTVKAKMSGDIPPGKGLERTYIRKDGTTFPVLIDDFIVKDKDGRIKGIRAIHRDITDIKQAEEEKKKLEEQLQQAQKLESIGTLAGGIAHDFNNILSPIMIHSEMAMMELSPESPLQHNLKEIFKASERARDMVKQILAFSRKGEGERAAIKITRILKEVLKMLRSSIPTTIDIRQNLEAESDTVLADPTQIHQIMLNLGTNAAHAMREKGGTLKVSLVQEDFDSEAAAQYNDLNPGPYLKLTVSDTGHGINSKTMIKIFEPYFTTKEVGEGTGMGLALIHGIVKSYGGEITVESEVGKGTTFNVYLPRIEADVSPVEEPSVKLPRGTERILFVDDDEVAVDTIQPMLENLGYRVTARTSSIEAIEAFKNDPNRFDLVITDQTMPNMTGKDLAKELMSIRPDIPIILCTGFSEQIDEHKAKEMGISAYVMKPIVMRDMANTIRQVLDKK